MLRIDCQSHVFPRAYVEVLARSSGSPRAVRNGSDFVVAYGDVQTFRVSDEMYDPLRKLRAMDEARIDLALISTNIPGPCMLAAETGVQAARLINDGIAELVARHPDRFAGLASLPWQEPEAALAEMDRACSMGMRGAVLYSHVGGRPVDDPAFAPVFAHAERKGLPIVLHPTVPVWGEHIKDHSMITMLGLQVDTSFALLRLILAGVLERHPLLQVVMPHVGGVLPYMIGRIDHQTEVMGRGRRHISAPPSDYLRRVYFDTVTPSPAALQYACDFIGAERMLLGTDHPWVDCRMPVGLVEAMPISEAQRAQILGENAQRLFGL